MVMPVAVAMAMVGTIGADAADMVTVSGLGRAELGAIAEDLRAVLAELAIHHRVADTDLLDALGEGIEDQRMVTQIGRLHEFDIREGGSHRIGLLIDALDQDPGEE